MPNLDAFVCNIKSLTDDQIIYLVARFGLVWGISVADTPLLEQLGKLQDASRFKSRLYKAVSN